MWRQGKFVKISLFNAQGRLVQLDRTQALGTEFETQISLGTLHAGMYILKVVQGEQNVGTERIIIE